MTHKKRTLMARDIERLENTSPVNIIGDIAECGCTLVACTDCTACSNQSCCCSLSCAAVSCVAGQVCVVSNVANVE